MSNRIVMGVLIVIVLVLAGAGFTWFKNSTSPSTKDSPLSSAAVETRTEVQADSNASPMSLKDLAGSKTSQKCTFSDSEAKSSGTVYTAQGKMRGDFTTTSQTQNLESHMISDTQTAYMWTEGTTQGMKISMEKFVTPSAVPATTSATQNQGNFDINKKANYKCEAWSVDTSMFQIPITVQFSDMSAMMQQVKSSTGATIDSKAACSACERLSGAAKEQCRAALSC